MAPAKPRGAHPRNRLSPAAVRNLGPGFWGDGGGLYLKVDGSGGRSWILRTIVHGHRRDIGLGRADLVGLADAREKARELRRIAREGGDPIVERDKNRRTSPTFAEAAEHVFKTRILPATTKPEGMEQWIGRLKIHAFPKIGKKALHTITQADLLAVLEPVWLTKAETARRVKQRMAVIFDWARTAGHVDGVNPLDGIEAGLPRQRDKVTHLAALPWRDLPALWPRLEADTGMGSLALRFAILTATRSGEVRGATWDEIDIDAATWVIAGERMKTDRPHRVPLSTAALAVLAEAAHRRAGPLVFPAPRGGKLSDMTLTAVLRRLDVPVTAHGFRSSFRDWAEEAVSFPHEVKEAALAHAVKNKVEAAYRRTDLFERRKELMGVWARFATGGARSVARIA